MLHELFYIVMANDSSSSCRQRFAFWLVKQKVACLVTSLHDLHTCKLWGRNFFELERVDALLVDSRSKSAILMVGGWLKIGLSQRVLGSKRALISFLSLHVPMLMMFISHREVCRAQTQIKDVIKVSHFLRAPIWYPWIRRGLFV